MDFSQIYVREAEDYTAEELKEKFQYGGKGIEFREFVKSLVTAHVLVYKKSNSKMEKPIEKESMEILSNELKEKIYAFGTTAAIGIVATVFIKEKARTFIYMLSIIISVILKGEIGMYIVLGIYALDEFVIRVLYKYYSNKVSINKEIDLRE